MVVRRRSSSEAGGGISDIYVCIYIFIQLRGRVNGRWHGSSISSSSLPPSRVIYHDIHFHFHFHDFLARVDYIFCPLLM